MSASKEIIVTLPGGRRVDAQLGRHTLHTDQPLDNGGTDAAPSPFDVFLGAMGACAGIFVQGFCAKRELPTEEIRIVVRPEFAADGVLSAVDFELQLPAGFPEKYTDAVVRAVDGCTVKRAIAALPKLTVRAVPAGTLPSEAPGIH